MTKAHVLVSAMLLVLAALATGLLPSGASAQEGFNGPAACRDCHDIEHETWAESDHGSSFKSMHLRSLSKRLVEALGGAGSARQQPLCQQCHFTVAPGARGDGSHATRGTLV